jgi:hypothetical protein
MVLPAGASGYFSAPSNTLDPNLFDGDILKPEVRSLITVTACNAMRDEGLKNPGSWLGLWITGSGITYQWDANRGNGDLDVMVGVDYSVFTQYNRKFAGVDEESASAFINGELKAKVWPATSMVTFGTSVYEVTFFWNPGTENDVRNIHPYSAYDVLSNEWVIKPPELPEDPRTLYPVEWFTRADRDRDFTADLLARYNSVSGDFAAAPHGSPGYHNAGARLNIITDQASALWSDIHQGRQLAFKEQGHGYGDWHNFRWQMAKANGVVGGLHDIVAASGEHDKAAETELYGAPIASAQEVLRRAAMWNSGRVQ